MAENVKIDVGALNRFLNRTVQPYLRRKAEEIADEARRTAPVGATGDLQSSITITEGARGSVRVEVNAPHAGYVTHGTGPAVGRPAYYPKLRRRGLILWSESKGLNPGAVAQGIARTGTDPNSYFEDSIARVLGRFNFLWIRKELDK